MQFIRHYRLQQYLRKDSPGPYLQSLREMKKSLIKLHAETVVKRQDDRARMCEWAVDRCCSVVKRSLQYTLYNALFRLDKGMAQVRKHAQEQDEAISKGDAVKAEVSRSMMAEVKRQAVDEVHRKMEVGLRRIVSYN